MRGLVRSEHMLQGPIVQLRVPPRSRPNRCPFRGQPGWRWRESRDEIDRVLRGRVGVAVAMAWGRSRVTHKISSAGDSVVVAAGAGAPATLASQVMVEKTQEAWCR